jgi:ABC-2 type transport system ATP-binding protein
VTPILVLERAHARDVAGPRGRARGVLGGVSLALGAGVHAFLGAPADGTLALADLVVGARAPLRGKVTVTGRDPARAAFVRARIGALGAEPRLPTAPTVRASVRLAMRARGESGDLFDAVLDPLGLSHLQARAPRSLTFAEQRAVELALALSTPAPVLLALHEPLCDVALPSLDALHLRLREAAAAGACVLVTTSSPADARALSDHVLVLQKGLVVREARDGAGLVSGDGITLTAWVRSGARELCAALALRPEVRAVSWRESGAQTGDPEGGSAPTSPGEPSVLEVSGDHAEACALALIDVALATGAEIEAMTEAAPTLGDVRVTTEMLWKALRAHPAPAPPPAPPPATPEAALAPAAPVDPVAVGAPAAPPPEPGAEP